MSKTGWIVGAVVLASVAGTGIYLAKGKKEGPKFRKEKVDRGDVTATVTASGTLSAVTTVKVGSQVSGIISRLHADFNSPVRRGQLLAELDQTPFQASVDQRRADLERSKVELRNAELSYARAKSLSEQQLMSQAEFDAAKAARDSAAAAVAQSAAALRQAETNLAYTSIVSPIDGVVVDRQYDVGQTVAASFQAPTLFTIAQDLTKMQVATNIDEADIGRVKTGQKASFTVDAFPDRKFEGVVSQIRLSPQTVQNVVTYPVLLDVENPRGDLKPGMTANVQVPVQTEENALRVPNAALRFKPAASDLAEAPKAGGKGEAGGSGPEKGAARAAAAGGSRPAGGEGRAAAEGRAGAEGRRPGGEGRPGAAGPGGGAGPEGRRPGGNARESAVYVEGPGGKLRKVPVRTLLTDGNVTAVRSEQLKEGDEIVIGLATARAMEGGSMVGGRPGGGRRGM